MSRPRPNTRKNLIIAYVVAAIGVLFGMYGHYTGSECTKIILRQQGIINADSATILGLHETNIALKTSAWLNYDNITRNRADIDTMAARIARLERVVSILTKKP